MRHDEQIRCWKDPDYREARASGGHALPTHPAGTVEVPDDELAAAVGGRTEWIWSFACCGGFTDKCATITEGWICTRLCTMTMVTTRREEGCNET